MLCLPREERASCAAPTTRCLSYAPCSAPRTGEAETIHHSGTAWRSFARHGTGDDERRRGRGEEKSSRAGFPTLVTHPLETALPVYRKKGKKAQKAQKPGPEDGGVEGFRPQLPHFTPSRQHALTPLPYPYPYPIPIASNSSHPYLIPIPIATPTPTHPASQQSEHFASAL